MSHRIVNDLPVIEATWNAPKHIKAYSTTRLGGISLLPFDSFNLGLSVGDDRDAVIHNRATLMQSLNLPEPPRWISQTHSTLVHDASKIEAICEGDASFTHHPKQVCAVLTADCLPVLLTNQSGTFVSAIHAGWRGLLNGIIEESLEKIDTDHTTTIAWLAPAISQQAFEVGPEVKDAFINSNSAYAAHFIPSQRQNHYYADLYAIARDKLMSHHIHHHNIFGGDHCTFSNPDLFYSHRRDGKDAGRQASIIWIEATD